MEAVAKPTYGLNVPRVDAFAESKLKSPGFLAEVGSNFALSTIPQAVQSFRNSLYAEEPGYNAWDNLDGYEMFADRLVLARSPAQMNAMKQQIDRNMADRELLSRGEYGLVAGLTAGLFDPINYIPIPGVTGVGFVRGALRAGAANIALTAATEPIRIASDPTADWSEMQYSLTMAGLLGAGLGGIAGSFRARGVRAARSERAPVTLDDMWRAVSQDEGDNLARTFNAQNEDISRIFGHTGEYDPVSGRYKPVHMSMTDVIVPTKQGPDGQTYRWDEAQGWINEASPERPVGQDVLDVLGQPDMVSQERMIVDDVTLKHEYEQGKWVNDLPEEARPQASQLIRTKDEYLDFRQLEVVYRNRLTPQPGEAPEAFSARAANAALNELQARRVPSATARSGILSRIAAASNMSPVAKAIRIFQKDAVLSDLPLQIAGDNGWMTEANRVGIATNPSVAMQTLRHTKVISDLRTTLDAAWLKFVTRRGDIKGVTFAGQNLSAALSQLQASVKSTLGDNVLTFDDFRNMVGKAIFENDDFEVNGFAVLPEAREAAEVISKTFREYDQTQRELGLYRDQKGLKRTIQRADRSIIDLKDQMTRWIWGGKDSPGAVKAAIRVGDRVYEGATYQDAINALLDERGAEGRAALEQITPADYGYSRAGKPKKAGKNTRIVGAAVKVGDQVFYDVNHFEALRRAATELGRSMDDLIAEGDTIPDGFATNDGLFVTREEAADIARNASQLADNDAAGRPIMTEDLAGQTKVDLKSGSFKLTPPEGRFIGQSDLIASRVDSLTERQRAVYDDMASQLSRLEQERASAAEALARVTDEPHTFTDQQGRPEGYFTRYYDENAITSNRPKFERLITAIFARDNPLGAAERAKSFVDDMLGLSDVADEAPSYGTGTRHLHERKIKVGNSFKIVDPEFGEIKLSDFIETDVEVVFDTYIRRAGARIEMARAFGDPDLMGTLHDIEMHWREKVLTPDMSPDEVAAARASFNEYKGNIELMRDDVLGRLKTASPWRIDNRIAKHLRELGQISRLGKVMYSVVPELARPGMVNGFGTAFKATFLRFYATLEQLDRRSELMKLTAEILDMNLPHAAARLSELNTADIRRGSGYERAISRFVPTFFKLNGLTPYTVIAKNISMTAAQHRIMQDAIAIAADLNAGRQPDATLVARNAADGISLRDNLLLAKMPFERSGNDLILPAVDKWTGSDGRRARNLLVNSLQVNARRTIITPGAADLPLIARGVFTWKGQKVFESELLGLMFMFKGYGMAATQKLILSGLQGRDVSFASGIIAMLMLGGVATYLKTPDNAWRNKSYEDLMLESYENSGIGGFLFNDLNNMVETYSMQKFGLRPMMGLDPRITPTSPLSQYVDMLGPGGSVYGKVAEAFLAPDLSTTNRAQMIRRQIPGATLLYLDSLTRRLVETGAAGFDE